MTAGTVTLGRRCAKAQVVLAALFSVVAMYLAVATSDDIARFGEPSLQGASVSAFVLFAVGAAALSLVLSVSVMAAFRRVGRAWWTAAICEGAIGAWLVASAAGSMSGGGVAAVVWCFGVLLSIGAGVGLATIRMVGTPSALNSHVA
jgi:hypothetical protein